MKNLLSLKTNKVPPKKSDLDIQFIQLFEKYLYLRIVIEMYNNKYSHFRKFIYLLSNSILILKLILDD